MNENDVAMSRGVETFLESIGLLSYAPTFLAKGFDRESDLLHLQPEDLDTMLISDPGHRRVLLSAGRCQYVVCSNYGRHYKCRIPKIWINPK